MDPVVAQSRDQNAGDEPPVAFLTGCGLVLTRPDWYPGLLSSEIPKSGGEEDCTVRNTNVVKAGALFLMIGMLVLPISGSSKPTPPPAPEDTSTCIARNGMVAAGNILAAQAGIEVLKTGGNAFDAAIAVSMAMGVVEPFASGIGGGGFAILYNAREQKTYMLDFREMAPAKAAPDMYKLDEQGRIANRASSLGFFAVAVPGTVRGMEELHKRFGTVKWDALLQPAIDYADKGAPVTRHLRASYMDAAESFSLSPSRRFLEAVFSDDGLPKEIGDTFRNPELAESLRKIAKGGADVFYTGDIGKAIVREFEKPGATNWITMADLENFHATWREPIRGTYRGYTIITSPPPSSGGTTLLEILNILEGYDLAAMGHLSADQIHYYIEAQRLAYADRNRYLADPAFTNVPVSGLIDKAYAREQRRRIDPSKDLGVVQPGNPQGYESGNTTSFSVADKDGNVITVTQTINGYFGAGVVPEGTGILLNDEMADFVPDPSSVNAPGPGKRPLSSITPTLLLKDGKPFATLGAPGGQRIITAVGTVILNLVDFGMDIAKAVDAPRLHNGNGKGTAIESRTPADVVKQLSDRGHQMQPTSDYDRGMGSVQGIMYLPDGRIQGIGDRRRDGAAVGY
jgi:gamma-glutamyltranspeptidase/glutathione hydrolase